MNNNNIKISPLSIFNININGLVDDLIRLFPDKKYLQVFKLKFETLIKYNPRRSYNLFKSEVYIYKNEIINRDSNFFLKKKYNDRLKNNDINSNWSLDKILDIKNIWGQLSNDNKNIIWEYFSVLIICAEKINMNDCSKMTSKIST